MTPTRLTGLPDCIGDPGVELGGELGVGALDEVEVSGVQTTLPFHRFVARHAGFRSGAVSIEWVAHEWEPVVEADRGAALQLAASVAAATAAGVAANTSDADSSAGSAFSPHASTPSGSAHDATAWRHAGRRAAVDGWPR